MKKIILSLLTASGFLNSCNYLDVVPDNVATIEYAFRTPFTTEQYLFTCYSKLPDYANLNANPAIAGGDEIWFLRSRYENGYRAFQLAEGNVDITSPIYDYWTGALGGKPLWEGINQCNIFLENIDDVYGMEVHLKRRMAAEAKFLKAYYHFWLLRMYGPIPIMDQTVPIHSTPDFVKSIVRQSIDDVFAYIERTLDEAIDELPDFVDFEVNELGRVTKPIALAMKAKILVTAASPLFNGNNEFLHYKNAKGEPLFNPTKDDTKWIKAAEAAKTAIDKCYEIGLELNYVQQSSVNKESPTTLNQLSFRTALTERWNREIIWASTNSRVGVNNSASSVGTANLQTISYPRIFPGSANYFGGEASVPMHIADKFYTKNGVPIEEDKTYNYDGRHDISTATVDDQFNLQSGYQTANIHFNREDRFYASLSFDGSRWYGQGRVNESVLPLSTTSAFYVNSRAGGAASGHAYSYSITGYNPKKLVNFLNAATATQWTVQQYPFPIMRLADLYLLYAEAHNEAYGPSIESYEYINLVRERVGLPSVQSAWTNFSRSPNKIQTKEGLREIIHRERTIELAFEGSRFWDVRRWKTALAEYNQNVVGWDLIQKDPVAYYRPVTITKKSFQQKDYFFPIKESELIKNKEIMQSPGW
jgi:hypothetical protein